MFRIWFSPQFCNLDLALSKSGDVLIVNGDPLDFSDLPDDGEYPADAIDNPAVIGGVKRVDGEIQVTLRLPYSNPNAPEAVTFPQPIIVSVDGPIVLPEGRSKEVQNATE